MHRMASIFAITLAAQISPAEAFDDLMHLTSKPRAIASFEIREQAIEISAVTRRKRADTAIRQDFLEESRAMGKVLPGYPQPAFVSFDISLKF